MKSKDQPVELIGVPLDHGAGQRGVAMGPTALRIAGLTKALERLELNVIDGGDIAVPIPELEKPGDPKARYLETISQTCEQLSDRV
ncbi:MAG: arginase family protein, partial [Planctomycetota bacterium]